MTLKPLFLGGGSWGAQHKACGILDPNQGLNPGSQQ